MGYTWGNFRTTEQGNSHGTHEGRSEYREIPMGHMRGNFRTTFSYFSIRFSFFLLTTNTLKIHKKVNMCFRGFKSHLNLAKNENFSKNNLHIPMGHTRGNFRTTFSYFSIRFSFFLLTTNTLKIHKKVNMCFRGFKSHLNLAKNENFSKNNLHI